jgi:hypothetical protein
MDITGEYCDCKRSSKPVDDIETGGHADIVPAPKTAGLRLRVGGGDGQPKRIAIAVIVVAIIVVAALVFRARRPMASPDKFFTRYAQEEPTRSYTPYAGSVPYGPWGDNPWAYAYDLELPQDEYFYLPPPYRPFMDVL